MSEQDSQPLNEDVANNVPAQPAATTSIYTMTRQEIAKGIANRFVHSRTYIFLYLGMAALSVTTVILSLTDGCPGPAFYVLEVIINTSMIIEVWIRIIALGNQFWRSPFNVVDLILTFFCALTLLVIAFAGCGNTSKQEEILDTLLLVARNVLQFGRLAAVMRQSGQSIFFRPKPIDISAVRRAGIGLDMDDEEYQDDPESGQPLIGDRNRVLFDAGSEQRPKSNAIPMPHAVQAAQERELEDVWG